MKRAIIIFTKVPIAGRTKTRLMPQLTAQQCAELHTCFLRDIRRECEACDADIYVCYTPAGEEDKALLMDILGAQQGWFPQQEADLGERMYCALAEVFAMGYAQCVLIGTDVPELRTADLTQAFAVLEERDTVFGGTCDGGYYLVGMKMAHREAFELDRYGHSDVLTDTVEAVQRFGITVGYTTTLADMDTPEDLRGYRERMREHAPKLCRTHTGRYLAGIAPISIIIPIYNEEKCIVQLQEQLRGLRDRCEILFADGGSSDRTLALLEPDYAILHCPKGRAAQMNMGAQASSGEILFFLHCDSELPPDSLTEIRRVMRDYRAGCFGIAFYSRNFFMFTCRVISNHRVKDRKVMFGDQGIFIERKLFFDSGMFPEIPVMEDYQFSLTLKEKRVRLGLAKHRIHTSDRRFPKGTIAKLKLMWKMNRLRKMYRDGVSPEMLAQLYRDIR